MSRAEPSIAPRTGTTESFKLHRRALGMPDLMFFIIAASAPLTAIAGVLILLVLGIANFNSLILFGGGIVGLIVGAALKRSRPEVYERIGGGAEE
jgi:hypothetical protein